MEGRICCSAMQRVKRGEGGRALYSTWLSIFSCSAASVGLFPVYGRAKFSCIQAEACFGYKNRNKPMVTVCRTRARSAASLRGQSTKKEWKKPETHRVHEAESYVCTCSNTGRKCVLSDQNHSRDRCVIWHVALLQHFKGIIHTPKTAFTSF